MWHAFIEYIFAPPFLFFVGHPMTCDAVLVAAFVATIVYVIREN
jgi:hypothetical protein